MSPLANQNPLAQLNDIIGPKTASYWPPAPIYWLLLLLTAVFIAASVYLWNRTKQQRRNQRQALNKLQQLQTDNASFILLNQLIKGVALLYFPRRQVASLHGEQWFDFLQRYATTPLFASRQEFLKRLYSNARQSCSADDFAQAKKWIKQLPKQIKKQRKKATTHV